MDEDQIEYVQWRLSSKHPKLDICDRHAKLDAYGLGPGVYPKADAPKPPAHPFCLCVVSPRIDLDPKTPPRFNPKAERTFLASLPAQEAARVAGSYAKRLRVLDGGGTLEAIYNEGKDDLYKWKRLGDVVVKSTPMYQAHPNIHRSGDLLRLQTAQSLIKAHSSQQWGQKDLTRHKKQTSRLLAQLTPYQSDPEVADF